MAKVGIILGSDSDLPLIQECFNILEDFGIDFELAIASAHRTPEASIKWAAGAAERGIKVIVAAAGGAAHLPGVVAAHTILPVIGIPIETKISGGLDSILSIIQMPSGVPVAAMAAGKAGGANAALFAVEILSLSDESLSRKLSGYRKKMALKIAEKNEKLAKIGHAEYIKNLKDPK